MWYIAISPPDKEWGKDSHFSGVKMARGENGSRTPAVVV
jgi:hypothetical protein